MEGRAAITTEAAAVEEHAVAAHLGGRAHHSLLGHLLEYDGSQGTAGQSRCIYTYLLTVYAISLV